MRIMNYAIGQWENMPILLYHTLHHDGAVLINKIVVFKLLCVFLNFVLDDVVFFVSR